MLRQGSPARTQAERLEVLSQVRAVYVDLVDAERMLSPEALAALGPLPRRFNLALPEDRVAVQMVADAVKAVEEMEERLESDLAVVDNLLLAAFDGDESCQASVRAAVTKSIGSLEDRRAFLAKQIPRGALEAIAAGELKAEARAAREGWSANKEGSEARDTPLFFIQEKLRALDVSQARLTKEGVAQLANSTKLFWARLNGVPQSVETNPLGLPVPPSKRAVVEFQGRALKLEVEELEERLLEVSTKRESRLRKKGVRARTFLAQEIRELDEEVNAIRRKLGVRTLQLEMVTILSALEAEVLDFSSYLGSDEITLLLAEFGILERQLEKQARLVDADQAIVVDDNVLNALAADIPDLKSRLNIMDETTASRDWKQSIMLSYQESAQKFKDGWEFAGQGLRLMGSDVTYSLGLFWRALQGYTLKPREVKSLRRTFRDLATLIPFIIILVLPLTPIGHVLVFSFIQRYFPGFFPSPFTTRRQLLMARYRSIEEEIARATSGFQVDADESAATVAAIASLAGGDWDSSWWNTDDEDEEQADDAVDVEIEPSGSTAGATPVPKDEEKKKD
eukprot:jgi/Mesvir1/20987/Mv08050-RA.2